MYDYSESIYVNSKTKVIIICKLHGKFKQLSANHIIAGQGCPKCSKNKQRVPDLKSVEKRKQTFIEKANKKHCDKNLIPLFDYNDVKYVNNTTKVIKLKTFSNPIGDTMKYLSKKSIFFKGFGETYFS